MLQLTSLSKQNAGSRTRCKGLRIFTLKRVKYKTALPLHPEGEAAHDTPLVAKVQALS